MSKIKYLFNIIGMLIFSCLVLVFTILCILKFTVLDKNYILSMYSSKHYKEVEIYLKDEMKKSMISSGIDNEVIDDIFNKNDIKQSTEEMLSIIYDGNIKEIDVSLIEDRLRKNVEDNIKRKNFTLEDEIGYNRFVKSIIDIYKGEFIMFNQISKVSKVVNKIEKYFNYVFISLSVILILISIILLIKKKLFMYLPISLFVSSFLILFGIFYSDKIVGFSDITIISMTFSEVLRKIIFNVFALYKNISIVFVIIGMIIIFFRKEKKKI